MHFLKSLVFAIALVDTGVAFIHRAAIDFKKHEYHFSLPVGIIDTIVMPSVETAFVLAAIFLFKSNLFLSLGVLIACAVRFLTIRRKIKFETWNDLRIIQLGYYLPKIFLWYLFFDLYQ